MEVQQRPDVGRRTTVDLECIWLRGSGVSVNAVIGKGPLQLGKWDKQLCCLEAGSISWLRWSSVHRGDAGACQPASLSGGFDDLQHLCQYLWRFLGRWWWWWSSVLSLKRWRGFAALGPADLGFRWSRTPHPPKKEKKMLNLSNWLKKCFQECGWKQF